MAEVPAGAPAFADLHPHWQAELKKAHGEIRSLRQRVGLGTSFDHLPVSWQDKIKSLRTDGAKWRAQLRELELAVAQADNGAVAARLAELQACN
jgi:hypothetical protein